MQKRVTRTLREQTQQLLDGPLKHIRGAALAAALLPLASIAATPASAQQSVCPSGGVCGSVFNDTNGNGVQDVGETGFDTHPVTFCVLTAVDPTCDTNNTVSSATDQNGFYQFQAPVGASVAILIPIPTDMQSSPGNPGTVVVISGVGYSEVTVVVGDTGTRTNFGYFTTAATNPGTGTPGYWKNHPDAWPVSSITIGPNTYTEDQAIGYLSSTGKDKSITMFQSYVAAFLSIQIGNDGSCVTKEMSDAISWLTTYPVGSKIAGGSAAWAAGQQTQSTLDAYDNGLLCAPHRK